MKIDIKADNAPLFSGSAGAEFILTGAFKPNESFKKWNIQTEFFR